MSARLRPGSFQLRTEARASCSRLYHEPPRTERYFCSLSYQSAVHSHTFPTISRTPYGEAPVGKEPTGTVLNGVVDAIRPVLSCRNVPTVKPNRHASVFQLLREGENKLGILACITNENMIPHGFLTHHSRTTLGWAKIKAQPRAKAR